MTENKKEAHNGIIAKNNELFRAVWDNSNDGMRLTDETGRIVKVNRAYCEIVGKNEVDLEGQLLGIVYTDPHGDVVLEKYRQNYSLKAERKYLEEKFQLWNGKEVWLGVSVSFINLSGNNSLVLSVFHDITSRKEKEQQLKLQSLVLDQIYDNVTISDLNGIIKYVNKAECKMMNCTPDDLVGKHEKIYGDVTQEGKGYDDIFRQILDKGSWRDETHKFNRKGEKVILDNRGKLVYDDNGKAIGVCGISTDITKRKLYENQLENNEKTLKEQNKRLEKLNKKLKESNLHIKEINKELSVARKKAEESNRLKTDFLANMSHEIRTPMNGILGFTNLLKRTNKEEKRDHYISIIEQSGNRMLNIINNVIDVSKIEAGLMEVVIEKTNLNNLLGGLFEFFRPEAERSGLKLFLHTGPPDKESIFETDRHKLEQIMSNLINNAIKFTESGQIDIGYRIIGSEIEFFVRDTGPGIDQADKEAIFIRFWRVKDTAKPGSDGTGLGLPIASSLASLMGGNIRVDSEKDKGSEFIVTLPFSSLIKKK